MTQSDDDISDTNAITNTNINAAAGAAGGSIALPADIRPDADAAKNLKTEKRILHISLAGSIAFLVAEAIFAIMTRSMAVLMDCVYDLADLVMIGPFLALVPLLYKPETEKRPYGFTQIESLFVLIKYMILLTIDAVLIVESIQLILRGGNKVNASTVAIFEIAVSAGCLLMYLLLTRMNRKFSTPSLKAELFIWKLDAASTMAVGLAFVLGLILSHTKFAFIVPYVDPGIAVILAVVLLKEPLTMIFSSIRNIILFAPEKEITQKIREEAQSELDEYNFTITFQDVIRAGRKLWIEIYFRTDEPAVSMTELKTAHDAVLQRLAGEFDNISVELIPDIDFVAKAAKPAAETAWRKEKLDYISGREEKKQLKREKKTQQ